MLGNRIGIHIHAKKMYGQTERQIDILVAGLLQSRGPLNKFGQLIDASFRLIFLTDDYFFIEGRTNRHTSLQFYISVMFLGLPDDIHEEKPSFLQFKKKTRYQPTDRRTDRPTDGRTDPLIEMRGRI